MKRKIVALICAATIFVLYGCMLFGTSPKETEKANESIEFSTTEDSSSEEETTSEISIEDTTEEESSIEESSCFEEESSEETSIEESSQEETSIEEEDGKHIMGLPSSPDIITDLNVVIYNYQSNGNNPEDAILYLNDINYYLKLYAPTGMWISGAMAQAFTEGGSGKTGIYTRTNNCFGIRAGANWDGYVFARNTQLVYKDYQTAMRYGARDLFRAYNNIEESVKDYVSLIQNGYTGALETESPESYLNYLLNRGYGEKSMYYTWTWVIKYFNLKQYDIVE